MERARATWSVPAPSRLAALAVGLLWAGTAPAAPLFVADPEGDWFAGASWSGGLAPTSADDPRILNGATATASSSSPAYPGGGATVEAGSLGIGSGDAGVDGASGVLEVEDLDLVVAGELLVGVRVGGTAPGPFAGALTTTGGPGADGDVVVGGATRVGAIAAEAGDDVAAGPVASGQLDVAGDFETFHLLAVGTNSHHGSAHGELSTGGELRLRAEDPVFGGPRAEIDVGVTRVGTASDGSPTQGSLEVASDLRVLDGGEYPGTTLRVGVSQPLFDSARASADGTARIGGDLVDFLLIEVGVATGIAQEIGATGTIEVLGRATAPFEPGSQPSQLLVGVTPGSSSPTQSIRAEGHATFGELEARQVHVGVAGAGPATGRLEIGSGQAFGEVGVTHSSHEAHGTLIGGDAYLSSIIVARSVGGSNLSGTPFITGHAEGWVEAAQVRSAMVGSTDSDGSSLGHLEVATLAPLRAHEGRGGVRIGVQGRGAGSAQGSMLVRSGGIEATSVQVGLNGAPEHHRSDEPSGTAMGTLESWGDVETTTGGAVRDLVGYGNPVSRGHADGTWILHEGTYTSHGLTVGHSEGTGTAVGRMHLDRVHARVDDLVLGDGATLELDVLGLARGLEYSAFDVETATLAGQLVLSLGEQAGVGVYDLILSQSIDGLLGDFLGVTVTGLAAGLRATTGIESTSRDGTPVAVYRLRVAPVPEPGPGALLALGLATLAARRRSPRPFE